MQTINLDISRKGIIPPLYAKQGEVGRKFKAVITDNSVDYAIPDDAAISIWYCGTSGEGNYTEINGEPAVTVDGNTVTVELIAQMLLCHGGGTLCIVINGQDGSQIGTWNITYITEKVPGADSEEAQQYYTAFAQAVANIKDGETPYVGENGNWWIGETDTGVIAQGTDGVGITSVKQTTTSTADGGKNVFTVTLDNGNTATFTVRNGTKGNDGDDGKTAYEYAQEAGYTGTEEEFAEQLANGGAEEVVISSEAPTDEAAKVWINPDEEDEGGTAGKSAYEYAVEGGYTGTEEEFAAKMAEEFPDAVVNPSTASVGQTIIVKEVDENGKPTAWEAADYQPRTHYENYTEVVPETVVTVEDSFGNFEPAFTIVEGKLYRVTVDGVVYEVYASEVEGFLGIMVDNSMFICDGSVYDFESGMGIVTKSDTITSVTLSIAEVKVEKIPTKFVPSLEEMRTEEKVLLTETTLAPDENGDMSFMVSEAPSAGTICTVVYNGTEYVCEAADCSELAGEECSVLGNIGSLMGTGDTGEPFALVILSTGVGFVTPLDGSETVTLAITGSKATKIPDKYLPAYLPFRFTATVDGATITANVAVAALEAAVASGRQIIMEVTVNDVLTEFCLLVAVAADSSVNSYGKVYAFSNSDYSFALTPREDGSYIVTNNS